MFANFIHPVTGEKRQVKIGLSWTLFFFGKFFGIPFFIRKMYSLGIIICVLNIVHIIISFVDDYYQTKFLVPLSYGEIGLLFVLLFQGNKMTAQYYLKQGFRIENDDELVKKQVKIAWKFTDDVFVENNLKEEK